MNTGSNYDPSPLCCCEYVDINGERNHILTCCCSCTELDSLVDSIICCRGKRKCVELRAVCRVFQDRMRIPWLGGAKHINVGTLLPTVLTLLLFVIASQGWTFMFISFFFLISFMTFPREKYCSLNVESSFQAKVFYSSMVTVVVVYEHLVVPQLEITFSENMVFVVFMVISALAFYITTLKWGNVGTSQIPEGPTWSRQCYLCNQAVHSTDFHSGWHGCCIGIHNRLWYILSLSSLMIAVFDCSYLTLTTVCRPYELVEDLILVPQECDEVFIQWQYSICFVSGVFSLLFSGVLFLILVREFIFISIGFTLTEWKCLPLYQKLYLGLISHRPHSKGFMLNWFQVLRRSYV